MMAWLSRTLSPWPWDVSTTPTRLHTGHKSNFWSAFLSFFQFRLRSKMVPSAWWKGSWWSACASVGGILSHWSTGIVPLSQTTQSPAGAAATPSTAPSRCSLPTTTTSNASALTNWARTGLWSRSGTTLTTEYFFFISASSLFLLPPCKTLPLKKIHNKTVHTLKIHIRMSYLLQGKFKLLLLFLTLVLP